MQVVQISDWDLEDRLSADHGPIVVQFVKTGAKDQEIAREEFRALAAVYPDAPFYEIDLLENPSVARKFALSKRFLTAKPVTLVFVDGVEQTRHVGSRLVGTVERILGPQPEDRERG